MFSREQKTMIAGMVEVLLMSLQHSEMPMNKARFILHVDGESEWSWANIRDKDSTSEPVPDNLIRNMSIK